MFAEDYDLRPPSTSSADVYLKESSLFRYLPLRLSGVFCTAASVLNPRRIEEKNLPIGWQDLHEKPRQQPVWCDQTIDPEHVLTVTGVTSGSALELGTGVGLRITEADIQFIFGYVFLNS